MFYVFGKGNLPSNESDQRMDRLGITSLLLITMVGIRVHRAMEIIFSLCESKKIEQINELHVLMIDVDISRIIQ